MKQITIYKLVDVDADEKPNEGSQVFIITNRGSKYSTSYQHGEFTWRGYSIIFWLKELTFIEIEGALYESIEHFNKVHGESFEAGEMWEYSNWKVGNLNKPNKSDFLKEKTK